MKIQRVERHIIKPSKKNFAIFKELSHNSKNLYNYCNFILRQSFFENKALPGEYDLVTQLTKENQVDYRSLPAQSSKLVIKLLYKNWKAFFKALKSYQKDKSRFTSNPKLPKYKKKDGMNTIVFGKQQIRIKQGESLTKLHFPEKYNGKELKIEPIITKVDLETSTIKQVRMVPKTTCFIVEVVYETKTIETPKIDGSFLSIDLGLNNFVTSIDNQSRTPFIINGKGIKSINQFYNKIKAKYQGISIKSNKLYSTKRLNNLSHKRTNKIDDFMHKASNYIIKHCIKHKIQTVVVGKNDGWKQDINLGKRTNQNFVSIPFESFINKLTYKCENFGIKLITTNESYTSKCDHFAGEEMKHHENYLGKRIKRGLFKSSTGKTLNADINGAIGIARKVFHDAVKSLVDSGTVFVPIKININI